MEQVNDITKNFDRLFYPKSALVFYQNETNEGQVYVEHFDMDANGCPVNAHPLTVREAQQLAKALNTQRKIKRSFLTPDGILPCHILRVDPSDKGSVLWYTKAQKQQLFFTEKLGIPSGMAAVPPLLWHATKHNLSVFALATTSRPTENTPLYHAPFFNVYQNGNVCMGTVNVAITNSASVQEFTKAWERYFFHSYFSHLMQGHNPVKRNCVSLWKGLIGTGKAFPKEVLRKSGKILKDRLG